ncbi:MULTISPECIES: hydroxymethylbilane synthase [unclassified Mangrovimonas]|uniref:hydroxymethylbilane synthase n=1 Tax=unclassified Mangrovimonas TaxID=2622855 RepID=UPI0006B5FCC4|nr:MULTISPECIES: hydroxymethylbilane synthase [unclassified Mangrovimonas]NIK90794.1 hydroxymethylbilane synthase [Mangrovimonas sp. CR14]
MSKIIRIGTRDSKLALWQAETVQNNLQQLGYRTELVPVKSQGDLILDKPLYELGITGVFTKTLDIAMIQGDVDIAVHSMKDVPTRLPNGIIEGAVLKRANIEDILVYKKLDFLESKGTIATGSLRRKAQWLHKYPNHEVTGLRGNVITRLQKLEESDWDGAIFAKAGLERIEILPENHISLDWMIPAPAQGAMLVVCMDSDEFSIEAVSKLNHQETQICVGIEREFLKVLEGGCTAPIGAIAKINHDQIDFKGVLLSLDGKDKISIERTIALDNYTGFGKACALEVLENGGYNLMQSIKKELS